MWKAFEEGRMRDFDQYDEVKKDLLLKHGFDQDHVWLVDMDLVEGNTGVLFFHESGNWLQHKEFDLNSMESFEEACKYLGHYFD